MSKYNGTYSTWTSPQGLPQLNPCNYIKILMFADIHSKGLWFYLPILCFLNFNASMFALTAKEISAMDATLKEMGMDTRDDEMDRYYLVFQMSGQVTISTCFA